MKKYLLAGVVCLLLLFVSCAPSVPITLSSDAYFVSFTFLKSLNSGLDKDYEASWNSNRNAWVAGSVPATTNVNVITPIFKAVDGTKVFANGSEVTSGLSSFNFSNPVVFTIIAADGSSKNWTIVLDKLEPLPPSITIMSYNAADFYSGGAQRHAQIAQMIKNASAEIVVLCEVQANGPNDDNLTQDDITLVKSALANLGWAMPYSCFADYAYTGNDDIAILSKYPITSSGEILPGSSTTWPRAGIKAVIQISDGTTSVEYTVMGFHLKAMEDGLPKRISQAKALADYLRATYSASTLSSGYFIIAGDMNTVADGDRSPTTTCTIGYLRLLDDTDSSNDFIAVNEMWIPNVPTYTTGTTVLDHIILSPALYSKYRSGSVTVKTADPNYTMTDLSDHYPVLLELDL